MGMYNEVHANCPKCGQATTIQIYQVVEGFGNFNLDDLNTFNDLTLDQAKRVKELVNDEMFCCRNEDCNHRWHPFEGQPGNRIEEIHKLFRRE